MFSWFQTAPSEQIAAKGVGTISPIAMAGTGANPSCNCSLEVVLIFISGTSITVLELRLPVLSFAGVMDCHSFLGEAEGATC